MTDREILETLLRQVGKLTEDVSFLRQDAVSSWAEINAKLDTVRDQVMRLSEELTEQRRESAETQSRIAFLSHQVWEHEQEIMTLKNARQG